jgi:holin (3TMs family)
MGGLVTAFKTLLGGDPLEGIGKIIEEFHMPPEQQAQLKVALAAQQIDLEKAQLARDAALAELQSQNITAETSSTDAFVRRARPTFLYVMIGAIAFSLVVCPIANAFLHKGLVPMEIPSAYLELFGVGFLGYTGARTWEKVKGKG